MPARNFDDLHANGLYSWPAAIAAKEHKSSIIPRLLETQGKFISLLHVADASPLAWKTTLQSTTAFPANLFLKHLMVLADISGEKLKNHAQKLRQAFPDQKMYFTWNQQEHVYEFQTLAKRKWDNKTLLVDSDGLLREAELKPYIEDVAMLILFGGLAKTASSIDWMTEHCVIGLLLGKKAELNRFVRERYIWVSRITGGAKANRLGQLAQAFVKEQLVALLPGWGFDKHAIPGISQTGGRTKMTFDIVAESPIGKFCAIEVSFQVTTNSTIELKAGRARDRMELLHAKGHRIAYVIDGAGNFFRKPAVTTICASTDCTVTLKDSELRALADFLAKTRGR